MTVQSYTIPCCPIIKTATFSILTRFIFDALIEKNDRIKIEFHSIKQLYSLTFCEKNEKKILKRISKVTVYSMLCGAQHSTNKANSNFQYIPFLAMKN